MRQFVKIFFFLLGFYNLFFYNILHSQATSKILRITGDSLKGKIVNGINIREVIGDVVITQDDIVITCNKAIQYIISNNVELLGNVIIKQDSITIKTERGKYFGNTKIAQSDTTVFLTNYKMKLNADKGSYNLNTKIANFFGNVFFKDTSTTLTSSKLKYFKDKEILKAFVNVEVKDSVSVIKADSLFHNRITKFSEGFSNIEIGNKDNNLTIFGNYLIDDKEKKYSKITGKPFLTQIENHDDGTTDTLFIKSQIMEAYKDSVSSLYAIDSVKIVRGSFRSTNDYTIYDNSNEKITILKQKEKPQPILWYGNNQVIGDSIFIKIDSGKVSNVDILNNSIVISKDSLFNFRFNQISGDSVFLHFDSGKLYKTNVNGNVLSIYYLFEKQEPNGLIKSSAKRITILLDKHIVSDVKMYGEPNSEYYPENLVLNKEKEFTLPTFIIYDKKPQREEFDILIKQKKNNKVNHE
ncbi:MAG: hypothetical protein CR986_01770 [Ignavibacteriae bacterium]|nr:MAG: hypothetical protein CR986_01770 [Ignavibacteriota bacterium]